MRDPDKAARDEARDICARAEVHSMSDTAEEIASMLRSLAPTPTLDELPQFSADPQARERQLLLLWLVERRFRFRLQDNLRRSLELLAGEPVVL